MRKITKDGASGAKLKAQKRRGISDGKENIQNDATADSSSSGVLSVKDLFSNIITRLQPKSIAQLKLVSPDWKSSIEDPDFSNVQYTRSKACHRLLFMVPESKSKMSYKEEPVYFKSADLLLSEGKGRVTSTIQSIGKSKDFECAHILGAVNGLICFIEKSDEDAAACVYNISTREVTPWVKSTVQDDCEFRLFVYGFGFHPATNQFKVICIWEEVKEEEYKRRSNRRNISGVRPETGRQVCEVWTVGDDSWRRINEVLPDMSSLPFGFGKGLSSTSVYVNGSIYWLPDMSSGNWRDESGNWKDAFILAVDVGSEKFRTIQIFESVVGHCLDPSNSSLLEHHVDLLQVNGKLAIIHSVGALAIRLYYVEIGREEWTEETLTLPGALGTNPVQALYCHSIPGTNQMILEIHQTKSKGDARSVSFYSYDWDSESFTKMNIRGIPTSVKNFYYSIVCTPFRDSLFCFPKVEKKKCCTEETPRFTFPAKNFR